MTSSDNLSQQTEQTDELQTLPYEVEAESVEFRNVGREGEVVVNLPGSDEAIVAYTKYADELYEALMNHSELEFPLGDSSE